MSGKTSSPAVSNNDTPNILINGVSAGNTVTVYDGSTAIGSGTVASGSSTITITTSQLSQGSHTLTVTAIDSASSLSGTSTAFTYAVDKTISKPTANSSTSTSFVLNAGNSETDWASVVVTGGTATGTTITASAVSSGNTCTINGITSNINGQTVIFTVIDNAGNTSSFTAIWNGSSWSIP